MRIFRNFTAIVLAAFVFAVLYVYADASKGKQEAKLSVTGYIHHTFNPENGHVYLFKNHNVVVVKENFDHVQVQASFFSNDRPSSTELIENMLWLMQSTGANPGFLNEATKKLPNKAEINTTAFDTTLLEPDGTAHRFALARTGHNQLYVLTYERI